MSIQAPAASGPGASPSASAAATVVVVGSVNMDLVAHAARLPAPGETLIGERFAGTPGGKGGNQAVAASRLGADVALIGRVGLRQHGHELLQALEAERVQTQTIRRDDQAWPGIAVIMVAREDGENAIVVVPGSNADLSEQDIDGAAATLRQAKVVVAQLEVPVPAIQRAFEIARSGGVTTVLNAAPAQDLPAALLAQTDWLVVNETEAAQLAGAAVPQTGDALTMARAAAAVLRQRGPRQVLVTLGGQGAWLLADDHPEGLHLAATRVDAVDTVGAGDTLVGGLAVGLAEGLSAARAAMLGQSAAALAVSRTGVQQAMPHRSELPPLPPQPAAIGGASPSAKSSATSAGAVPAPSFNA
ncbi:ribokinase [Roseateles amylovorans]|uniref:Ribokinase n=1 Tax=Roseateles amylovorans TaxID=2978473 RepID=A0ABY6B4L9_9BURK|nr:ribokinase [Roseateles amylovorans]UXH80204.1 ribokinase [Roseateles amylovorans]